MVDEVVVGTAEATCFWESYVRPAFIDLYSDEVVALVDSYAKRRAATGLRSWNRERALTNFLFDLTQAALVAMTRYATFEATVEVPALPAASE